jgi:hypothetical protein
MLFAVTRGTDILVKSRTIPLCRDLAGGGHELFLLADRAPNPGGG